MNQAAIHPKKVCMEKYNKNYKLNYYALLTGGMSKNLSDLKHLQLPPTVHCRGRPKCRSKNVAGCKRKKQGISINKIN